MNKCDSCGQPLRRQAKGAWWIGDDETADCPANEAGHTVNGALR